MAQPASVRSEFIIYSPLSTFPSDVYINRSPATRSRPESCFRGGRFGEGGRSTSTRALIYMRIQEIRASAAVVAGLTIGVTANAIPALQLDIQGGTYDTDSETTVAAGDAFTLYALGLSQGGTTITTSTSYYLAAALIPSQAKTDPGPNFGSFTIGLDSNNDGSINGTETLITVNVTADMVYGVPPVETNLAHDGGDLPKHGIYETYFKELSFNFSNSLKTAPYNAESEGKVALPNGSGNMFYVPFLVDVSGLTDGYGLHFDLYSSSVRRGDWDVDKAAPFSHDAQSKTTRTFQPIPTPDGGATLALMGVGLIALGGLRRRMR